MAPQPLNPDWRRRLDHARAVRDAMAIMNGIDLEHIIDPKDGLAYFSPDWMRRFDGKQFTQLMAERGHTLAAYDMCTCSKDPHGS